MKDYLEWTRGFDEGWTESRDNQVTKINIGNKETLINALAYIKELEADIVNISKMAIENIWVKTADRLPTKSGDYLVYGRCTGEKYDSWDTASFERESQSFHKHRQPTHWQELPMKPNDLNKPPLCSSWPD